MPVLSVTVYNLHRMERYKRPMPLSDDRCDQSDQACGFPWNECHYKRPFIADMMRIDFC